MATVDDIYNATVNNGNALIRVLDCIEANNKQFYDELIKRQTKIQRFNRGSSDNYKWRVINVAITGVLRLYMEKIKLIERIDKTHWVSKHPSIWCQATHLRVYENMQDDFLEAMGIKKAGE